MDLSIVLASYKEGENLKILLPKIHNVMKKVGMTYEILIIDALNVLDDSPNVCAEFSATYINGGDSYGDAIRCGINAANGQKLLIMDADGSHDPEYIPKLIEKQKETNCDLVIGSRYVDGGDSYNGPILKMMSKVLNFTYRFVFNIYAKDISGSFRLYNSSQIKSLQLECVNFDIVEEIIIQLVNKYSNFKVVEIPIRFNQRQFGDSKRNLVLFIFSYIQTMIRLYKIKRKVKRIK